jgi:DNA recombination protein RmuC
LPATIGWIVLGIAVINTALLVIVLVRALAARGDESERAVREELRTGREESARAAKDLREEVSGSLKEVSETITRTMGELGKHQTERLEGVATQLARHGRRAAPTDAGGEREEARRDA